MNDKAIAAFRESVKNGLSSKQKHLSSRYFYDDEGSRLFQKIMELPEYYLSNAEFEILQHQSHDIYKALDFQEPFNIVELGAGDGKKTIQLLQYLSGQAIDFTYVPIDISKGAIESLEKNVSLAVPGIKIHSLVGDYFDMLQSLNVEKKPMLLLFLGSNIGNFSIPDAHSLISKLSHEMNHKDKLLLGIDLQKNPNIIRNAYNDSADVTRAFNLNLLRRINRELAANFVMDYWDFYATYNPVNGEVRSFIVSLKEQIVQINSMNESFHFAKNELIYTELSRKYTKAEIQDLAKQNDLLVKNFFLDSNAYFTDALLVK